MGVATRDGSRADLVARRAELDRQLAEVTERMGPAVTPADRHRVARLHCRRELLLALRAIVDRRLSTGVEDVTSDLADAV
jgi:hypothetical protein